MNKIKALLMCMCVVFTSCSLLLSYGTVEDSFNSPCTEHLDIGETDGDYIMPIGVPDAWITPDIQEPDRPSLWETEQVGYYYIDYDAGVDTENTYGTPEAPRKTIPNPIPAGSYVVVNGNYAYIQNVIKITGEGTGDTWVAGESGPVWVVGESSDNRAEITEVKMLVSGSYIYIEDFYFHSGGKIQFGSYEDGHQVDHILFRNSEIEGEEDVTGGILINTVGLEDEPASNILIYNNSAHSIGPLDSDTDIDARGVALGKYTSNVWVVKNQLYDSSAGLQVEAGSSTLQSDTNHIYIGHNHVYNVAQAGIAVKYALDIIISENTVHDIIDTPWSPGKCIGFQYAPDRVWILFNKLSNTNTGIRGGSDNGDALALSVFIIGNEIQNINASYGDKDGPGIEINNGASSRYIINNTVVNCDIAIQNYYYNSTMIMENNLLSNSKYYDINLISGYITGSQSTLNNTHFDETAKISWGDNVTRDLINFQDEYNKGDSSISSDPLFTNYDLCDFTLQSTSDAIGAGLKPSELTFNVFDHFETLYGIDISDSSGSWDLGAY